MNTPGIPTGRGTPSPPARREVQLQGPRPTPLRVNKDSHKIRKPPPVPRNHQQPQSQPLTLPAANDDRQPVIIYDVSPKVYHADASNFMSVVQQLTGNYSSASSSNDPFVVGGGGTGCVPPVSPAARLASIERTSPTERNRERERSAVNSEFVGMVEAGIDVSHIPGILSPAPSNLPGITPGMFFPTVSDSQTLWAIHDYLMSPPVFGNSFVPSPYALLSSVSPVVSPTISPADLFDFGDF